MQTSTRLLSLINAQLTILADKGNQTERLGAELKRLEDGKPPYYIAVGIKTAMKLLNMGNKAGMDICDILTDAQEKTLINQQWELKSYMDETEQKELREAHRKELVKVIAAGHMQNIYMHVINRATEGLCQAQMYIIGADGGNSPVGWVPEGDSLAASLTELRNLTMSYAHDMATYISNIEDYDTPKKTDAYEVRTPKEALQMIQAFTSKLMEGAIGLVDIAYHSVSAVENAEAWDKKGRIECLSAYGIAAASFSQFACDILGNAMKAIGTVTVAGIATSKYVPEEDLHASIAALTSKNANYRMN